jgi:hypothetical protein
MALPSAIAAQHCGDSDDASPRKSSSSSSSSDSNTNRDRDSGSAYSLRQDVGNGLYMFISSLSYLVLISNLWDKMTTNLNKGKCDTMCTFTFFFYV